MNIKAKIKDKLKLPPKKQSESGPVAVLVEITIPSKPPFYQLQFFKSPSVGHVEYYGKAKVEIIEILGREQ